MTCGMARVNVRCAAGSAGIICQTDCRHVSVLASEFHDVGAGVRISGEQYSRFVVLGSKSQESCTHVLKGKCVTDSFEITEIL